jgi:hypothetical protein
VCDEEADTGTGDVTSVCDEEAEIGTDDLTHMCEEEANIVTYTITASDGRVPRAGFYEVV